MVEPVGPQSISEVRFIRNTTDADAQMVGNESTDVAGGKDFFDSCCLFTWCQATDHHHPPRNLALFKNLESVATAPQFLEASKTKAETRGTEGAARVRQPLRHDNDAE